ncbi:MAG TPA: hypothetical protein VGI10_14660 [Polyangiaceae bacterium]
MIAPQTPPRTVIALCGQAHPFGDPQQMTIAPGASEGPSVTAPQLCGDTGWSAGAYIKVHGHGARHFNYTHTRGACDAPEADPGACPTVSILAFAGAVIVALRARLGASHADGLGLGVCGNFNGPLSQWNISSRVHDWRFVDEALRVIDEELRRWNLGDDYGLSISGFDCAVQLSDTRRR